MCANGHIVWKAKLTLRWLIAFLPRKWWWWKEKATTARWRVLFVQWKAYLLFWWICWWVLEPNSALGWTSSGFFLPLLLWALLSLRLNVSFLLKLVQYLLFYFFYYPKSIKRTTNDDQNVILKPHQFLLFLYKIFISISICKFIFKWFF